MRLLSLVGLAAVVALGSSPAWAQDTKPQATTAAGGVNKVAVKDPEEIVCIHQMSIDSRIPGKAECHTRRIWDEMSDQAHRNAQDLQQRSGTLAQTRGG
jgi:hypothetical protein